MVVKKFADVLAMKRNESYSCVVGWMQCCLAFLLVRSAIWCALIVLHLSWDTSPGTGRPGPGRGMDGVGRDFTSNYFTFILLFIVNSFSFVFKANHYLPLQSLLCMLCVKRLK